MFDVAVFPLMFVTSPWIKTIRKAGVNTMPISRTVFNRLVSLYAEYDPAGEPFSIRNLWEWLNAQFQPKSQTPP
jgi:hypothetical protein